MTLVYIIGPTSVKQTYLLNDPSIYNWSLLSKKKQNKKNLFAEWSSYLEQSLSMPFEIEN